MAYDSNDSYNTVDEGEFEYDPYYDDPIGNDETEELW